MSDDACVHSYMAKLWGKDDDTKDDDTKDGKVVLTTTSYSTSKSDICTRVLH